MTFRIDHRPGFTLIEIIVAIAILTIILSMVFVALNPQERVRDARNATRIADVNAIADAIVSYKTDEGFMPKGRVGTAAQSIDDTNRMLVTDERTSCSAAPCATPPPGGIGGCINLTDALREEFHSFPLDPLATDGRTLYYVKLTNQSVDGRSFQQLTVGACNVERASNDSTTIEAIR
jgi:prepilin-type N-terminal cleavage/methylation domain-containing protein